jgi:hypothetical protein
MAMETARDDAPTYRAGILLAFPSLRPYPYGTYIRSLHGNLFCCLCFPPARASNMSSCGSLLNVCDLDFCTMSSG